MNLRQIQKDIKNSGPEFWATQTEEHVQAMRDMAAASWQVRYEVHICSLLALVGIALSYAYTDFEPIRRDFSDIFLRGIFVVVFGLFCSVMGALFAVMIGLVLKSIWVSLMGDAHQILNSLKPLSETFIGCTRALELAKTAAGAAYRDKVVAAGRTLTVLDEDLMEMLAAEEESKSAQAERDAACRALHGLA